MDFVYQIWDTLYSLFSVPVAILRVIIGFLLVFFLPGFAWTLVFFSGKQVNLLERIVLSIGLSLALVVLSIFFLNIVAGVRITLLNSLLIISLVTLIPFAIYWLKRFLRHGSQEV